MVGFALIVIVAGPLPWSLVSKLYAAIPDARPAWFWVRTRVWPGLLRLMPVAPKSQILFVQTAAVTHPEKVLPSVVVTTTLVMFTASLVEGATTNAPPITKTARTTRAELFSLISLSPFCSWVSVPSNASGSLPPVALHFQSCLTGHPPSSLSIPRQPRVEARLVPIWKPLKNQGLAASGKVRCLGIVKVSNSPNRFPDQIMESQHHEAGKAWIPGRLVTIPSSRSIPV